jgi:hypothetical protein
LTTEFCMLYFGRYSGMENDYGIRADGDGIKLGRVRCPFLVRVFQWDSVVRFLLHNCWYAGGAWATGAGCEAPGSSTICFAAPLRQEGGWAGGLRPGI